MQEEHVEVTVGGAPFTSWTSVSVKRSKSETAPRILLNIADEVWRTTGRRRFLTGTEIVVTSSGDLLGKATIEKRGGRLSAREAGVDISARSKARNVVDSSHKHAKHHVKGKTVLDFAKEIDHTGTRWTASPDATKLMTTRDFHLNAGETIFHAVERYARLDGLTLMGNADHGIEIATAGTKRFADLIEGGNILDIAFDHDDSNRHAEYRVVGQQRLGTGADAHEIESVARDAGVTDPRTAVIVVEHHITKDQAKKRAQNRRDQAAGNALKCTVTVQGHHDDKGKLWEPNGLVFVNSPYADLSQDMLIEDTDHLKDARGSLTLLSLVDPRAHGGKKSGKNTSGKAWNATHPAAEVETPSATP